MATADTWYAYFHVRGTFDPDEITRKLGITPSRVATEGGTATRALLQASVLAPVDTPGGGAEGQALIDVLHLQHEPERVDLDRFLETSDHLVCP